MVDGCEGEEGMSINSIEEWRRFLRGSLLFRWCAVGRRRKRSGLEGDSGHWNIDDWQQVSAWRRRRLHHGSGKGDSLAVLNTGAC